MSKGISVKYSTYGLGKLPIERINSFAVPIVSFSAQFNDSFRIAGECNCLSGIS